MFPSFAQSLAMLALSTDLISAAAVKLPGFNRQGIFNTSTRGLIFDGRMAAGTPPSFFDSPSTSPYVVNSAMGAKLKWSKIIQTPQNLSQALFDPEGRESPIEVTLRLVISARLSSNYEWPSTNIYYSDASILRPINQPAESSIRRAELLPNISNPISAPPGMPQVSGMKTLHFSVQTSPVRPLNYSHEYQLVWMETQDLSHSQFILKTGTVDGETANEPQLLQLVGRDNSDLIFSVPFDDGVWHNFGIAMDFDRHTSQVYYSQDSFPLQQITTPMADDLSGGGEYHIGLYKKAIGSDPADPKHTGTQPSGINEGIVYSGIFLEDSAVVGVTLR